MKTNVALVKLKGDPVYIVFNIFKDLLRMFSFIIL